jgi:uncharacterized protein (DUF58 family)
MERLMSARDAVRLGIVGKRTIIYIAPGERGDEFEQVLEAIATSEDRDTTAAEDAALLARAILERWQAKEVS